MAIEPLTLKTADGLTLEAELHAPDGAIRSLSPYSDTGELNGILDAATAWRVIEARRPGAALHAYGSLASYPVGSAALFRSARTSLLCDR